MKTMSAALSFILFFSSLSCSLAFKQQDVYEELWTKNIDIANKTLQLDFLQQMQSNTLPGERYVSFTLQDINYVQEVTKMLEVMTKVSKPEDISNFMIGRYNSYKSFLDSLIKKYFLKDAASIMPTPAMKTYLTNYSMVMMTKDPIYFAVALLPCARLWVWLANKVNILPTNVYYQWQEDNKSGHPEEHYKALLNKYLDTDEKVNIAKGIFRMQMQNEYAFFKTS